MAQSITAVQQKKHFSDDKRKDFADIAIKYAIGMGIAKSRHSLSMEAMTEFDNKFVAGFYDKEVRRCTQPAMVGSNWSWVRSHVRESEEATKKQKFDELRAQVVAASVAKQEIDHCVASVSAERRELVHEKEKEAAAKTQDAIVSSMQMFVF